MIDFLAIYGAFSLIRTLIKILSPLIISSSGPARHWAEEE
jgi:hypothetical protein